MTHEFSYPGNELSIFQQAVNWKAYFQSLIDPYLRGQVVEVGAGLGATTRALLTDRVERWHCLEPDAALATQIRGTLAGAPLASRVDVHIGTLVDMPADRRFDAILYIDVLEHIADDRGELQQASAHLAEGGALIVLSPAHQWLYSAFDRHIGHVRRYTKRTLRAAAPPGLALASLRYLDAVGIAASFANRVLLTQSLPTGDQVLFWDRRLVPVSRVLDPLIGFTLGKSVLAIWRQPGRDETRR